MPESKDAPARKTGIAGLASGLTNSDATGKDHPLYQAMGGILGIFETLVPGIVFIVVYTVTFDPWLSIGISVGTSVLFTVYRLIRKQAPTQALVGLAGAVASAVLALVSQKPEDNFVVGLLTNAIYGTVFLVSVLIARPLVGVVVSMVRGESATWRANKHYLRVYSAVTMMWVAMFGLRLLVELPLYFAGNIAALATTKLVLGLPLYVPVLAATWLIIRSLYRERGNTVEKEIS